jgi:hypothetical protein
MYVKFLWTSLRARPRFISLLLNSLTLLPLTNAVSVGTQGFQRSIESFLSLY